MVTYNNGHMTHRFSSVVGLLEKKKKHNFRQSKYFADHNVTNIIIYYYVAIYFPAHYIPWFQWKGFFDIIIKYKV